MEYMDTNDGMAVSFEKASTCFQKSFPRRVSPANSDSHTSVCAHYFPALFLSKSASLFIIVFSSLDPTLCNHSSASLAPSDSKRVDLCRLPVLIRVPVPFVQPSSAHFLQKQQLIGESWNWVLRGERAAETAEQGHDGGWE